MQERLTDSREDIADLPQLTPLADVADAIQDYLECTSDYRNKMANIAGLCDLPRNEGRDIKVATNEYNGKPEDHWADLVFLRALLTANPALCEDESELKLLNHQLGGLKRLFTTDELAFFEVSEGKTAEERCAALFQMQVVFDKNLVERIGAERVIKTDRELLGKLSEIFSKKSRTGGHNDRFKSENIALYGLEALEGLSTEALKALLAFPEAEPYAEKLLEHKEHPEHVNFLAKYVRYGRQLAAAHLNPLFSLPTATRSKIIDAHVGSIRGEQNIYMPGHNQTYSVAERVGECAGDALKADREFLEWVEGSEVWEGLDMRALRSLKGVTTEALTQLGEDVVTGVFELAAPGEYLRNPANFEALVDHLGGLDELIESQSAGVYSDVFIATRRLLNDFSTEQMEAVLEACKEQDVRVLNIARYVFKHLHALSPEQLAALDYRFILGSYASSGSYDFGELVKRLQGRSPQAIAAMTESDWGLAHKSRFRHEIYQRY